MFYVFMWPHICRYSKERNNNDEDGTARSIIMLAFAESMD